MRDFNNYNGKTTNQNQSQEGFDVLKSFAKKYEGASEDKIISEILLEAQKGKKNGTLTNADVDRFKNMLYPMLNPSQRAKLDKVIKIIKES
ncbi:MAG: hypothetical protein E7358_06685 [Clostridiales bacterium]|nr:hypothetical protein [Clostridiales bacterium]